MELQRMDKGIGAFAVALVFVALMIQGSYFAVQYLALAGMLMLLFFLNSFYHVMVVDRTSLLFFMIFFVSYFVPLATVGPDWNKTSVESLRWLCFGLPLILSNDNLKSKFLIGAYAGIIGLSCLGIMAYFKMFPAGEWATKVDGVFRMQSTVGYANVTAVLCGSGVLLAILFRLRSKELKSLHTLLLCINLLGLALTRSRFGIAFFVAAILVVLCFKYRWVIYLSGAAFLLCVIGTVFLFATGREDILMGTTLVGRLIYWQDGLGLWLHNLLGIGAGQWENRQYAIQSTGYYVKFVHNGFLQIAIDGGIGALAAFVGLIFAGVFGLWKKWRETQEDIYPVLIGIVVFIALHGFVDIDFSFGGVLLVLGIILSFGRTPNMEIKKSVMLPVSALLIILSAALIVTQVQESKLEQDYDTLIACYETHPNEVSTVSKLFAIANTQGDSKGMYYWSKRWVELAPRQQNAYDAYFVSLGSILRETKDASYKREKELLYQRVESVNKTVNPLTKYYSGYKNIRIPDAE